MPRKYTDNTVRMLPIFYQSGTNEIGEPTFGEYRVEVTYYEASKLSTYWNEVRSNVPRGYPIKGELAKNPFVTDIHGVEHELIIDSPRIRKFTNSKTKEQREDFDRKFYKIKRGTARLTGEEKQRRQRSKEASRQRVRQYKRDAGGRFTK